MINMQIQYMDTQRIDALLPARKPNTHKGNYGKVLLLCGSKGFTGAAELAAKGALRSGAGLVYLGVPKSIYQIEATKLTEPVIFDLPDFRGRLSVFAWNKIKRRLRGIDAVLIGCGTGISRGTSFIIRKLLETFNGPVILDADGINVLSAHRDILRGRTGVTILTPHEKEFCRFAHQDRIQDRIEDSVKIAQQFGIILVLKGHETVITDGNHCYVNNTGNPGMAVGGCGDLLAGILTSLLGQGLAPVDAAAAAVWIHGRAGDICREEIGECGMLPTDMLKVLPRLLK